jgi:hypothetical protein
MLRVIFAVVLIATYALQKQRHELEEERAKSRILQEKMEDLANENSVLVRHKDELNESLDRVFGYEVTAKIGFAHGSPP